MSSGVHVERIAIESPSGAARRAADVALSRCGRSRACTVVVVSPGTQPGLCVAPWTLDGVRTAAAQRGLVTSTAHIGAQPDSSGSAAPHLRRAADPVTSLRIAAPSARAPLAIPRTWIGTHACIVATCAWSTSQSGPLGAAMAALAAACTRETLRDPTSVGAWVSEHVFASVGIVLDASWTTRRDDDRINAVEPTACILGSANASIQDVDQTANAMGPTLNAQRYASLATRRVDGLWRTSDPAPVVRGPLVRLWHAYPARAGERSP